MKLRSIFAGTMLGMAATFVAAQAAPVQYFFSGTVDATDFPGVIDIGDTFTGQFTFESTTSGSGAPNQQTYNALLSFSFQINGVQGLTTQSAEIQVDNDFAGPLGDRYFVLARFPDASSDSIGGNTIFDFSVLLGDSTQTAFSDAGLVQNLLLTNFDTRVFRANYRDDAGNELFFSGTLDPTPLPAALPLFASALAAMGVLGWRRRRQESAKATT